MKRLYFALMLLPLLASCCTAQTGPASQVGEAELIGKNFILTSVNGEAFSGSRVPSLRFNENMRISGQVCNSFNGPGQLKNGVLTVPQMASTMMLCGDKLNRLERDVAALLHSGAALSIENGALILGGMGISLEYHVVSPEK